MAGPAMMRRPRSWRCPGRRCRIGRRCRTRIGAVARPAPNGDGARPASSRHEGDGRARRARSGRRMTSSQATWVHAARNVRVGVHGKPPFEARPCRALALRRVRTQDRRRGASWHPVLGILVEPVGDVAFEACRSGSCRTPLTDVGSGRDRRRRAPLASPGVPRYSRDFVVPSGIPSVDATCGSGRSR